MLVVAAWLCSGGATADGAAPGRNGLIAVHDFRTGEPQAWMLRPDGRDVTRLPVYGEAAFSPDGRRLAITRGRTLSVTDLSGAGRRLIYRGPRGASYEQPAWSRADDEILFSQIFDGGVFAAPVSGGARRRIAVTGYEVDVSVTGRVALQLGETFADTRPRVITVDGEGGDRRPLGRGVSPSWAPDGSRVAFARGDRILVAAPDGTSPTTLLDLPDPTVDPGLPTPLLAEITALAWSPDGTQIAFVRSNVWRQRDSLMVLDLASGGVRKLLDNRAIDAINLSGVEWQPLTGADEITLPQSPPATGPCQLLGSKTIARSPRARVLTENGRYWGCLFARDRLYRLAPGPRYAVDSTYGNVALTGPYVGYALKYDDGHAIFADVRVQNLRNGRVVHRANSIDATNRVYQARVRRLVLSRRGTPAWVVRPSTGAGVPRPLQVRTLRRGRAVTLDAGPGIRASTLTLRGHRLTWRHGDRLRKARLR